MRVVYTGNNSVQQTVVLCTPYDIAVLDRHGLSKVLIFPSTFHRTETVNESTDRLRASFDG